MTQPSKNTPMRGPQVHGYLEAHAETLSWLMDVPEAVATRAVAEVGAEKVGWLIHYIIREKMDGISDQKTLMRLLWGIGRDMIPWCPTLLRHYITRIGDVRVMTKDTEFMSGLAVEDALQIMLFEHKEVLDELLDLYVSYTRGDDDLLAGQVRCLAMGVVSHCDVDIQQGRARHSRGFRVVLYRNKHSSQYRIII